MRVINRSYVYPLTSAIILIVAAITTEMGCRKTVSRIGQPSTVPGTLAPQPSDLATRPTMRVSLPHTDLQIELAYIPEGRFRSQRLAPTDAAGEVELNAFWMSTCEVTWELFQQYWRGDGDLSRRLRGDGRADVAEQIELAIASRPSLPWDLEIPGPTYPVFDVSQYAAQQFCNWLTARTGRTFRLPTEAEWEYACRTGMTAEVRSGGMPAAVDQCAWYGGNSGHRPHQVGTRTPNRWGLYDMHGNVAEWTLDGWSDYVPWAKGGPVSRDPWKPRSAGTRTGVIRGADCQASANELRCDWRAAEDDTVTFDLDWGWWNTGRMYKELKPRARYVGFRVVSPATQGPADGREASIQKYDEVVSYRRGPTDAVTRPAR